jgi:phage portal protein BeeE
MRMPGIMVGDYENAPYKSSEHQDLVFTKYSLQPLLTCIEQEINLKLFSVMNEVTGTQVYCKFNVNGLLKGDIKTRFESYEKALFNGFMTRQEVREKEDINPLPDSNAEKATVQSAMVFIEDLKNVYPNVSEERKIELDKIYSRNGNTVKNN